jgi:uncharacterized membrane protein
MNKSIAKALAFVLVTGLVAFMSWDFYKSLNTVWYVLLVWVGIVLLIAMVIWIIETLLGE